MNINTQLSNDIFITSKSKYAELFLIKLKNDLFEETMGIVINNKDNYSKNEIKLKIEGCKGILTGYQYNALYDFYTLQYTIHVSKNNKEQSKTYLIQDSLSLRYKIGKSINIPRRLQSIQTSGKLKIICILEKDIEKELHLKYKDKRKYGEWFELNNCDIEYIKNMG